jgi:hypothetical protein
MLYLMNGEKAVLNGVQLNGELLKCAAYAETMLLLKKGNS